MRIHSKLTTIALSTGLTVAGLTGAAAPAQAAVTGNTTATFTITAGTLDIVVPTSTVALATVNTGALLASGQLGAVTVTDNRGALVGNWTTTVSSSAFVTGTSTPNETVAPTAIGYSSGLATATSGAGAFTPGAVLGTLAAPGGTAASYAGIGNNTATWNPTLTFTLASSQVAGTYTGTVTHSVA